MEQRKYFKHKVVELEGVFENSKDDVAVLEELEEELDLHRNTQRAKTLLEAVRTHLGGEATDDLTNVTPIGAPIDEPLQHANQNDETELEIDWEAIISGAAQHAFEDVDGDIQAELANRPEDILDAWTALEALSPQSYKKPKDLVVPGGSVAYLRHDQEPWLKYEKARPKTQLYYVVHLGCVDLEKATEKLLAVYKDERIERQSVTGLASLGLIILDRSGVPIPDTGLAISSFGWAYARALQGKLHELKSWEAAEEALKDGLEKIIYKQDVNGTVPPFSLAKAEQAFEWLTRNCEIPDEDCSAPSFAIRQYQSLKKGAPDPDILNSFFLDDLQRAKHSVESGTPNKALSEYLGITRSGNQYDLLKDKTHIERALLPKNMPLGRWPSKGHHSLVLLQQTSVNLAMQELKEGGLFSVNGPPGTGKTTLLRDVVASVLVQRATALYAFKNTDDAFEHAGQMKLGNGFVHLYRLNKTLRGHEIVVASTNNKAVENVSKELPLREQIAEDIGDLNYFKTISDALSDGEEETWGSIAAVLGNSTNRNSFIQKAWWDKDCGLWNYFYSISGQLDIEVDENGEDIIPKIVQECDPPSSPEEANRRWEKARQRFAETIIKSKNIRDRAQRAYEASGQVSALRAQIRKITTKADEQRVLVSSAQEEKDALVSKIKDIELRKSNASHQKTRHGEKKPGFIKRLFARRVWREWKDKQNILLDNLKSIQTELRDAQDKQGQAYKEYEEKSKELKASNEKLASVKKFYQKALDVIEKEGTICGGKLVTPDLWGHSHDDQQKFTPNYTDEAQKIRDDVFIAAIELHKAFIDSSAKQVRQNLGAYFHCLGNGSLPQDKQALLPHLWSTAFLFTPVISTAFASVGRMLKNLPKDSIGWLLIDEAGQATPQAAVGAICRAKRVMSVGDPLQIEPVFTLPPTLVDGISKYMGVEPYHWMAPSASVQTLSDHANSYGTTIPRDLSEIRIGSPLLVHRRCEDPMFKISNRMAYNGLMVHATQPKPSGVTNFIGEQTAWFDIEGSAQEKWCPEEGEHVANMLIHAFNEFGSATDIFVISPFRMVADQMGMRMRQESERLAAYGIDDPNLWIRDNIGTVHTFQGKEAQAVILLLGAPSSMQNGARQWATSNVNLLNVAVSRAKQNFYVVGNRKLWSELGHMKIVSRYIK